MQQNFIYAAFFIYAANLSLLVSFHNWCEEGIEVIAPDAGVSTRAITMWIVLQDFGLHLASSLTHGIAVLGKLTCESISCSPTIECWRKIGGTQGADIVHRHTQSAVEGVDHAHGTCRHGNVVESIRLVSAVERSAVLQTRQLSNTSPLRMPPAENPTRAMFSGLMR